MSKIKENCSSYIQSFQGFASFRSEGPVNNPSSLERSEDEQQKMTDARTRSCVTLNLCTKFCRLRLTCPRQRIPLLLYAIVMDIRHRRFYPHEYMNHVAVKQCNIRSAIKENPETRLEIHGHVISRIAGV